LALIKCWECAREISDKAIACPGCGATAAAASLPVDYDRATDTFSGTMALMTRLAMCAVQELGWTLDTANEVIGFVTFQTRISPASWSGVSCYLNFEEVSPNKFRVSGAGRRNVCGDQLLALDPFGEAQSKARKAIEVMKRLAS
jgi:hypothetical protein